MCIPFFFFIGVFKITTDITHTDSSNPSIEELEHVLKIAAKVVAMYGDAYLTGFLRLKKEIELAKEKNNLKADAIALAKQIAGI